MLSLLRLLSAYFYLGIPSNEPYTIPDSEQHIGGGASTSVPKARLHCLRRSVHLLCWRAPVLDHFIQTQVLQLFRVLPLKKHEIGSNKQQQPIERGT